MMMIMHIFIAKKLVGANVANLSEKIREKVRSRVVAAKNVCTEQQPDGGDWSIAGE